MSWQVIFFPPEEERLSPYDYIINLSNSKEKAQIIHRLATLEKSNLGDWPQTWIHKITDKIYQLTAGQTRLMYCLDENKIVVLHACKKVGQKTRPKDIARAETHYRQYISQKESRYGKS